MAAMGAAFAWVFFSAITYDVPSISASGNNGPFFASHGAINTNFAIAGAVTTSLAMSAIIHGKIRVKDLIYGPFIGGAIIGSSAVLIFNPMAAFLLGVIAGLVQPLLNIADDKQASKPLFSTCVPYVFGVQGLLGSLAAGIMRAIRDNNSTFDYTTYPFPFRYDEAG